MELFGRSFHLQTEVCDGELRTEVFDGGRLIATRKAEVDRRAGAKTQRMRIGKLHQEILAEAIKRATRYREDPREVLDKEADLQTKKPTTKMKSDKGKVRAFPSPLPGSSHTRKAGSPREKKMAQVNLEPLAGIDGFIGTCLVDSDSGMMLGAHGNGNLELAAAGNTQVVRAKRKTMASLKLDDKIEDILISLNKQYHLIRILESSPAIFLYLMLDREKANLAMARHELKTFEASLNLG